MSDQPTLADLQALRSKQPTFGDLQTLKNKKQDSEKFLLNGSEPNAVERGFLKAGVGAGQILEKVGIGEKLGLPPYDEYTKSAKKLEDQGKGKGISSAVGEMAGNPFNLASLMLPGGKVAQAVIGGAISSLSEPVKSDNFAREKATQGIIGTGLGAFGGAIAKSIGALASPQFEKSVKLLVNEGVSMTPGTLAQGVLKGSVKRGESALASLPVLGSFMRDATKKSMEDFNKAVINRVLKPIGQKIPSGIQAGRDALSYAEKQLSNSYEKILPKISFKLDEQFLKDVRQFNQETVQKLPQDAQKHFEDLFNNIIGSRLKGGAPMDGQSFKSMESELAYEARTYAKSLDPAQRRLGDAMNELSGMLKENLSRMNPRYSNELNKINSAWAAFTKARDASIRSPSKMGLFSPQDLLSVAKQTTPRGIFARGNGLMQDLAEAGTQVLPSTVPDSGTTERALWATMIGGGGLAGHPLAALGAAVGSLPYSRPGMAATNLWAQKMDVPAVRSLADKMIPAAGVTAANTPEITEETHNAK